MGDGADMALSDMMDDDDRQMSTLGYSRVFNSGWRQARIDALNSMPANCPACGASIIKKKGTFGEFFGCSGFPRCKSFKPVPCYTGEEGLSDAERFEMDGEI
jgi:hypothetical protein